MFNVKDDLLVRPVDPVLRALAPVEGDEENSDDPLRAYLREIHEVNLLTARDERYLASRMEETTALDELVAPLRAETASEPSSLDILHELLARIRDSLWLLQTCASLLERPNLGELLTATDFRKRIDGVLDEDLVAALAERRGCDVAEIRRVLVLLSVDTRLLPDRVLRAECWDRPASLRTAGRAGHPTNPSIRALERLLEEFWRQIRAEASGHNDA